MLLPNIIPPHREPIHRAVVPGRIIAFGYDVLTEHTTRSVEERDLFHAQGRRGFQYDPLRVMQLCESLGRVCGLHSFSFISAPGETQFLRATRAFCRTLRPCWQFRDSTPPSTCQN